MATFLDKGHLTLADVLELKQYTPGAAFVREVQKKSKLMQILPWGPTSHGSLHKGVKATSLPAGKFVSYNQAIPTGKAGTKAYQKTTHMYELMNQVDERLFKGMTAEDASKVRAARDLLFGMGFSQGMADEIMNNPGTAVDAEGGVFSMRSKLGDYCFDMGKTSHLGSIILIKPGLDSFCLRYPDTDTAGFSVVDRGLVQMHETGSDGKIIGDYWGYETDWHAQYLIDNPDESALIRLANIDCSVALTKTEIEKIIDVIATLDNDGQGYIALAPQAIIGQFWKYLLDKSNIAFSKREVEGMGAPTHIFNVPFFAERYMTTNETQVE